jgi:hypothetical protein
MRCEQSVDTSVQARNVRIYRRVPTQFMSNVLTQGKPRVCWNPKYWNLDKFGARDISCILLNLETAALEIEH